MPKEHESPALFTLPASEFPAWKATLFASIQNSYPLKCDVAGACLLAEAAVQRVTIEAMRRVNADGQCVWEEFLALPPRVLEDVERVNDCLFKGNPSTIDLVLWDAAGYVHGWPLDANGAADATRGSFPEMLVDIARALRALADCDMEWNRLLVQEGTATLSIWKRSREKAEVIARERVASQGWLAKKVGNARVEKELVSLGFR